MCVCKCVKLEVAEHLCFDTLGPFLFLTNLNLSQQSVFVVTQTHLLSFCPLPLSLLYAQSDKFSRMWQQEVHGVSVQT